MEKGYIKINIDENNKYVVEADLQDGELWMSKNEIAYLFNVFVNTVNNNLRSIFKSGLLREENVTKIDKYTNSGRDCEIELYNLDVLIFLSYRISSCEAKAFREWIKNSLINSLNPNFERKTEIYVLLKQLTKLDKASLN